MKRYEIKRADGSVLVAEQTGENTFRLTLDGKPHNMTDSVELALIEGRIKK